MVNTILKMFTVNKHNLMETKNLLFKCENTMKEKLDCPNLIQLYYNFVCDNYIYRLFVFKFL